MTSKYGWRRIAKSQGWRINIVPPDEAWRFWAGGLYRDDVHLNIKAAATRDELEDRLERAWREYNSVD